ncbi:TylF/MycF family methyltransferase [Candidatus Pelagibacter ubique]|jgi:predicted O-methyltransferase YrrM|nr:TylF/MycF family methyltransferase [Candidatus Pelagibacter ubique]
MKYLKKIIKQLDKAILNGVLINLVNSNYKKKKIKEKKKNINFEFDNSQKKIILLSDLLNKSPNDGSIVECGVGAGFSLAVISHLTRKKIYAFDSFEGFPDIISEKDKSKSDTVDIGNVLKYSKFHYKYMSEDLVKSNLFKNNVNEEFIKNNIKMIKGFFPKSFQSFDEKISFLHLDVDLYDSYKECLKFFYPKVVSGGIITFDEYIDKKNKRSNKGWEWHGAKIAIDEFIEDKNLTLLTHPTGFNYVIKR